MKDSPILMNGTMLRDGSGGPSNEFYLQDSRTYVGNDVLFWAKDGKGYTTDLRNAEVFTRAKAQTRHNMRETDIPWPKEYIDQKTRPAVDMQYIKRDDALMGTGIEISQPERNRTPVMQCDGCGRFMKESDRWMGNCNHCGTDNRM